MVIKILKWTGIGVGAILALVIIASVVIGFLVTKEMIAEQMEKALNRHVTIGDISVGIFSIVSGIEVKEVKISNFKTPEQVKALAGKPVDANDVFVGLKALNLKLRFLPLLSKQFVLKELVLYEPVINVVKSKEGAFNFDDLIRPKKMTKEEQAELEKKKAEEAKKKAEEAKLPQKPLTADDIPIDITIGKVGVEKGTLTYVDKGLDQTFQVYNLTAMVYDIDIAPKELEKRDSVSVKIAMGVKTIGQVKSGSVKTFDIGFAINGKVVPFDKKTRILDPEAILKAGLPYGTMTGLQIFDKLKSVESLSKYCGKLEFLSKELKWKNAYVDVWYKGGTVKVTNGKIDTSEFLMHFSGTIGTVTKVIALDLDLTLADKYQVKIREGIQGNVKKILVGNIGKVLTPEKLTDIAMKRLTNKEGLVYLQYKVTGTMSNPNTQLVAPKLPSLGDLAKDSAGSVKDIAADKAKDLGKKAADKAKDKAADKAKDKIKGKFKLR